MATTIVEKQDDKNFNVTIGTSNLVVTVKSGGEVVTLGEVAQAALEAAEQAGLEDASRYVIAQKSKDDGTLMYENQVFVVQGQESLATFDTQEEVEPDSHVVFTSPQSNA